MRFQMIHNRFAVIAVLLLSTFAITGAQPKPRPPGPGFLGFSTVPVTYVIEGVFGRIVRETGGIDSTVFNEFMSIQFTVTDPTELFETPPNGLPNPNTGEFSVSSAFVTVPAFGLLDVAITNSNLTFFQADIGSLEQFGLLLTTSQSGPSRTFTDLLATEIGLDFIANPNQPLPLKFDLSGITLEIAGVPLLTLADGSILRFSEDPSIGFVPNAAIRNVQPFATFTATVEIELRPRRDDAFAVQSHFTLGAGSNGIDPLTEDVKLELMGGTGSFTTTIPAGYFKKDKKGRFQFEGTINGVDLQAKITRFGHHQFKCEVEGEQAELAGIANPVTVALTIGNDSGSTTVKARFNDDHDNHDDHDDNRHKDKDHLDKH